MIGGQEFVGVRKLKNKIEYIELLDASKKIGYNSRILKYGKNIDPYLVYKGKLSEEFTDSELWTKLTEQEPFNGKLEDLDLYLSK